MLPNAIVLAFDDRVQFQPHRRRSAVDYATVGELVIPVDESLPEDSKPALLVDGQQRSAAIRDADLAEFPVAAVGFIATTEDEQRSQFILVNNTKPLPKGLIHELLPETSGPMPVRFARRQLPAALLTRLNVDRDSPFRGAIQTPTSPNGYIKDNSVLRMMENSLYEGALYQYRDSTTGAGAVEDMLLHIKAFWNRVSTIWAEAWELPPRKSRLTHGVGIQSLGYVMDSLTEGYALRDIRKLDLHERLCDMRPHTFWTSGNWPFGPDDQRKWNTLQNTPSDVRALTNYLLRLCGSG